MGREAWSQLFPGDVCYRRDDARRFSHSTDDTVLFSGGHSEGVIPDPIPNSVVKPLCADGTARFSVWESRSPPESFLRERQLGYQQAGGLGEPTITSRTAKHRKCKAVVWRTLQKRA